MKSTMNLVFKKYVDIDNEGTYREERNRSLCAELTVKGNDCENKADKIMEIMVRELKANGYDFQFSSCPAIEYDEDGNMIEYWESMVIPFVNGSMTEYKEAVKEAYKTAKAELKKAPTADTKEAETVETVQEMEETVKESKEVAVTVESSYNIWNGTVNLKGVKIEAGQQLRVDLYNMNIEDVPELKGINYREFTEGHTDGNYTRLYIEILPYKTIAMIVPYSDSVISHDDAIKVVLKQYNCTWSENRGVITQTTEDGKGVNISIKLPIDKITSVTKKGDIIINNTTEPIKVYS